MYKRLLAALLSTAMFFSVLPITRAEAPLYVYPEINVTLLPDDQAALEMEFREWAADLIYEYMYGTYYAYYNHYADSPFDEYYLLAKAKFAYDAGHEKKTNIYNTVRDRDTDKEQTLFMWALLESVKETTYMHYKELMAVYKATDAKDRIYLAYNRETGGWVRDEYAVNAQEQSNDISISAWTSAVLDLVAATAETILQCKFSMKSNGKNYTSDLISGGISTIENSIDTIIEGAEANALLMARNEVRQMLVQDMAETVANLNVHATAFMRNSYQSIPEYEIVNYKTLLNEFLELTSPDNPLLYSAISHEVNQIDYDSAIQQLMSDVGYDELELISGWAIVGLAVVEAIGTILEEAADYLLEEAVKKFSGKEVSFTIPGINYEVKLSAADAIGAAHDIIVEYIKETRERISDDYYGKFLKGESMDARIPSSIGNSFIAALTSEEMKTKFIAEFTEFIFNCVVTDLPGDISEKEKEAVLTAIGEVVGSLVGMAVDKDDENAGFDMFEVITNMWSNIIESENKALNNQISQMQSIMENLNKKMENRISTNNRSSIPYHQKKWEEKAIKSGYNPAIERYKNEMKKLEAQIQEKAQSVMETLGNVWDRLWETGTSLGTAIDSTVAATSGEGRFSLWAGMVYAAYDMSKPVWHQCAVNDVWKLRISNVADRSAYDVICDPEITSLQDIVSVVSQIHSQLQYDSVGTQKYFDIAVHIYEDEDGDFVKFKNGGSRYYVNQSTDFFRYLNTNYRNIYGEPAILGSKYASNAYNTVDSLEKKYFTYLWNDDWYVFFE